MCLISAWDDHSIQYVRLSSRISVRDELPKSCATKQWCRTVSTTKDVGRKVWNPFLFEHRILNSQKGFKEPANVLRSELGKRQVVAVQKRIFFSSRFFVDAFSSNGLMMCFAAGRVAFAAYVNNSLTRTCKGLNFHLSSDKYNSLTKEGIRWQIDSGRLMLANEHWRKNRETGTNKLEWTKRWRK